MADDKKLIGERMQDFEQRMEASEERAEKAEKQAADTREKLSKMEGEYGPEGKAAKTMKPISQQEVEARAKKYRKRGVDRYEARGEDGQVVGSGVRPDALHAIAQLRSEGKYPAQDDDNRRVMATDGLRQEITITRIFGNTGKTAVVAAYQDGRLVKK